MFKKLKRRFAKEISFRFLITFLLAGVAPLVLFLLVIVLVTLGTNEPLSFANFSFLSPFYRLVIFVVVISLTTALAVYVVNRNVASSLLRPITLLREKDRQVTAGRLRESLIPEGEIPPDELGEVIRVRNRMIQRLVADEEELVRSERFVAIGQLASSIAHELRTPFMVLQNAVSVLKLSGLGKEEGKNKEYLDMIVRQVAASDQIVENLLHFARDKEAVPQVVSLNRLVEESLDQARPPISVQVLCHLDPATPVVNADPGQLKQVFINLILNAIEAMPEGGGLEVKTLSDGPRALVQFKDGGLGMTEETISKIFQPLFSTKPKGTGLGLTISKQLLEKNKGEIKVQSSPGKGTLFVLSFQRA
ncbi:MAG: hypothetical protein HYS22_03450 [Deltaproteobacteria bacterium]|nr:hypothetical protein [Deltaproteobacteria bacterium]